MKRFERNTALFTAYDDHEQDLDPAAASLLRAVLNTAILDLEKDGIPGRLAREYFLSDEQDYLFSFQSICSYLNIDAAQVLVSIGLDKPGQEGRP